MVPWYRPKNSDSTGRFIIHTILKGGVEEQIRYVSVRAGASFPSQDAAGAFVVVGQEVTLPQQELGASLGYKPKPA